MKCVQYHGVHVFAETVNFDLYAHLILIQSVRELTQEEKMYSSFMQTNPHYCKT